MSENTERLRIIGLSINAKWNNGKVQNILEIDDTIIKEFSREQIIICNDFSFESLNPGKEIDDNVCDLCLKW